MQQKQVDYIWVVVKVESGIPVTAEAYDNEQSAETTEQLWRKDMNPDNDEAGVFEISLRNARGTSKTYS